MKEWVWCSQLACLLPFVPRGSGNKEQKEEENGECGGMGAGEKEEEWGMRGVERGPQSWQLGM